MNIIKTLQNLDTNSINIDSIAEEVNQIKRKCQSKESSKKEKEIAD